jgi:predicted secreted protein
MSAILNRDVKTMRLFLIVALACCLALGSRAGAALKAASQDKPAARRITSTAVWNPEPGALDEIRRKCVEGNPAQHEACFVDAMKSAGASEEAVAFVKEFAPGNGLAYIRAFRDTGLVDVAYIEYLYRANELDGVLLVNGTPPMINVDDDKLVSQEDFRGNATAVALREDHPRISMWPGDRYHTDWPKAISSSTGDKFEVSYLLLDGCHACAGIGTAIMAFNFDSSGRFTGAHLIDVKTGADKDRPELNDNDRPELSRRPEPGSPEDAKEGKINPTEIHSKVGASFTIILAANHTTGYSWRLAKPLNSELVKQVSNAYDADTSGKIGAGGKELWTFEALSPGTAEIEFEYARPFEKNAAPADTAKYRVVIK